MKLSFHLEFDCFGSVLLLWFFHLEDKWENLSDLKVEAILKLSPPVLKVEESEQENRTETIKFQVEGKFHAPRELPLFGDSPIDINASSNMHIILSLEDTNGKPLKKEGVQPVPFHFQTLVERAREILQIAEEAQIKLFMQTGRDEIEINEANLERLKDNQTIVVRIPANYWIKFYPFLEV